MYQRLLEIGSATGAVLAIGATHWFPWRDVLPKGRELHKLEAYAIGTGIIWGCSTVALLVAERARLKMSPADCARLQTTVTMAAGAATLLAWAIDWAFDVERQPLGPGDF